MNDPKPYIEPTGFGGLGTPSPEPEPETDSGDETTEGGTEE